MLDPILVWTINRSSEKMDELSKSAGKLKSSLDTSKTSLKVIAAFFFLSLLVQGLTLLAVVGK